MKRYLLFALLLALLAATPFDVAAQKGRKTKKTTKATSTPAPTSTPVSTPVSTRGANTQTFTVNGVSFTMVRVEGGTFTMGATSEQGSDAYSDEKPAHKVTVLSFSIGQTEVTQELWRAVMGSNPSEFAPKRADASRCNYDSFVADAKRLNDKKPGTVRIPSREEWDVAMVTTSGSMKRPVENVSWDDCQTFIKKLNQLTGKNFRLPTEAEWEFAARGGNKSRGYKYSGSNNIDDVAWYEKNSYDKGKNSPDYGTHPVAGKRANELGIYDMSGNVWEWCQDKWYYYDGSSSSGSNRVDRGGGWDDLAGDCRVSNRNLDSPANRGNPLGLRLAL